jgi:hypothetical protein
MQNSQAGPAISGAVDAHVREHLAFIFRDQIAEELGTPMPPMDEHLPEHMERRLSELVAEAADQMLGKKQQQAQAEQAAEQQQDPIVQQRERELGIQESEVQRKQQADQAKQQLEQQKLEAQQQQDAAELELEREKIASRERIEAAELSLDEQALILKTQGAQQKFDADQELEGFKLGQQLGKDIEEEKEGGR